MNSERIHWSIVGNDAKVEFLSVYPTHLQKIGGVCHLGLDLWSEQWWRQVSMQLNGDGAEAGMLMW